MVKADTQPEIQADTQLLAIGTSVPNHQASQEDAAGFMKAVAAGMLDAGLLPGETALPRHCARIDRLARHSAITRRASVVADFLRAPADFDFFPRNAALEPPPSTAARMAVYQREAPPLAEAAAADCLRQADVPPRAVTHLILVSCTGFVAPGVDILLQRSVGLRPDLQRQTIGFMGCYAAFNGLRAADAICSARPDAVVLLVCVELCTLHFQRSLEPDAIVSNLLFSDGAAAALLTRTRPGPLALLRSSSRLCPEETAAQMTWTIGDHGFQMTLAAAVPESLRRALPSFVDDLLAPRHLTRADLSFWAVHPGGRRIVDVVHEELAVPAERLAPSHEVLSAHGNMSSATVLFVLQRWLMRDLPRGAVGVALAFGPGLTLEGALFERRTETGGHV